MLYSIHIKIVKFCFQIDERLSVQKNASGDIEILSKVFKVTDIGAGGTLFKTDHMTNYCYVIVDPMTRIVNVWYFNYVSIWG